MLYIKISFRNTLLPLITGVSDFLKLLRHRSSTFRHHFVEHAVGVLQQVVGVVEFHHGASLHDKNFVGVHDGVQSVRHRQYCTVRKLLTYRLLN